MPMVARHRFCGWTLATGYVTPDQDPGYTTYAAHADDFDAIHPAWWHLGADTNTLQAIYGQGEPILLNHTTYAGARTLLIPMIAAVDGNQPQLIHAMLYDAAARQSHIAKLVALAVNNRYDGLDLDYEHLPDGDRDAFSQFAREAAAALHAQGKTLSFAVQALVVKSSVWDYDALSAVVDQLHVMGYDFHGLGSPHPGPVAPLGWIQAHAAYVQSIAGGTRTQKFILGLPNYSIGGPENATTDFSSTSLDAIQLGAYATTTTHMTTCSLLNPGENWQAGRAPNIVTSAHGHVYFDDIASMEEKVTVAQQAGYGGITYWTIGGEPDRPGPLDFFQMVRAHFPKN
jgi:spore germination protein YaaH